MFLHTTFGLEQVKQKIFFNNKIGHISKLPFIIKTFYEWIHNKNSC